ncbi:MAG: hypothetical protein NT082_04030 [Chloroflexi bacterium]|nr:hypothetical protein [Chloroflexota bacterium]
MVTISTIVGVMKSDWKAMLLFCSIIGCTLMLAFMMFIASRSL